jgi:hypothetical protein
LGVIERVPIEDFIGSETWRRRHPHITFQEEFKLIATKREWDAEMAALLDRRSTWDLPDEEVVGDEPPQEPPEETA